MRFRDWATRVLLISLMFTTLIGAVIAGKLAKLPNNTISNPDAIAWNQYPPAKLQSQTQQAFEPKNLVKTPTVAKNQPVKRYETTQAFASYKPRYGVAAVDPSNYGERFTKDIYGEPTKNQAIIVIHETADSASSAVNFFQTHHDDETVQASYHALIAMDGTVVYLVPPDKRAFGAANSVFAGIDGIETVKTHPTLPPSVNNFAYHVSLETPPDGRGSNTLKAHSGYTEAQYNSLAWLIAQSQVPDDRITTHKEVDRSNQKVDPLSFDFNKFLDLLHTYRQLSPTYRANK